MQEQGLAYLHGRFGPEKEFMLKKLLIYLDVAQARPVAAVFAVQAVSLLLSLAVTLLVANRWGSAGYGIYAYAASWATLLGAYAGLGLDQAGLRLIPDYLNRSQHALIRGFFQVASLATLLCAMLLAAAALGFSVWLNFPQEEKTRQGMWLGLLMIPLVATINLRASWLRSMQQPVWSQLPDKIIRPLILLLLVLVFWRSAAEPVHVVAMAVVSTALALAITTFRSQQVMALQVNRIKPHRLTKTWLRLGLSLLLINGAYYLMAQLPTVLLGALYPSHETGLFAIAYRISDMEGYLLFALNVVLAPLIARLYSAGQKQELQMTVTRSLRFGFLMAMPLMVLCLLAPRWVLSFFGPSFGEAAPVLILLTAGQVFTFAMGPVGYLLTMTGHQGTAIRLLSGGALLNGMLCLLLIPPFGAMGAAIAAAASGAALNAAMAVAGYRLTGINPTLLT